MPFRLVCFWSKNDNVCKGVRTANSAPLFSQDEIQKAARDPQKKYFINYKIPSGDIDDKVTQKKYIGEW